MTILGPLHDIVRLLDDVAIPYMVVGSFASTYHGPPRTTQDIDVVVELTSESLDTLLTVVDLDRYYVAEASARVALVTRGRFNLIDLQTGWKVDLMVRKDRPFSHEEFARRQAVFIGDLELYMSSAEDTVLSKLEWARLGGSDRQVTDAASVLEVLGDKIDNAYLDHWAEDLRIEDLLARARREAGGAAPVR